MTAPSKPAVWPIIVAVEQALINDQIVSSMLNGEKVYAGRLAGASSLDYITITVPTETDWNFFGRRGSQGSLQLDLWCRLLYNAVQLYTEVARVLDYQRLPLMDGNMMVQGDTDLIMILNEPEDDTINHGIVRYTWKTLQ
jgi:hypothetical protein